MINNILNIPITNLERAKDYFYAMGCSHFHMSRESWDRYDEYRALSIDKETEKKWLREKLDKIFNHFPFGSNNSWSTFSYLCEHVHSEKDYLDKIVDIAEKEITLTPKNNKHLIISSITGSSSIPTHGGLIEFAFLENRNDLVDRLLIICLNTFSLFQKSNNPLHFTRGYFVDVVLALSLNIDKKIIKELRQKDNECLFTYYYDEAKSGNVFSMYMLGMHYLEGKGCIQDRKMAIKWLEKANEKGQIYAKKELEKLEFNLNKK